MQAEGDISMSVYLLVWEKKHPSGLEVLVFLFIKFLWKH